MDQTMTSYILINRLLNLQYLFCLVAITTVSFTVVNAQNKFYLGLSYGRSFPVGDFSDDNLENEDAGFAESGNKFDLYGGYFLDDKWTVTAVFRYQNFQTDLSNLVQQVEINNPGVTYTGSSGDWETYYFLVGISYSLNIANKLKLYPRFGIGPVFAQNPGFSVEAQGNNLLGNVTRSSETGIGLGYELGLGLVRELGRHFALMPTFTFSGGIITINDVVTEFDNTTLLIADYQPNILTFNLGLSLAYRF